MTVAQSEDTCVVSGMPRAAIVKGYANKIVSLDALSSFLVSHCGGERSEREKSDKQEKNQRTPVSSQRT
jgi:chemotaxis response regulator CheB